VVTKQHGQPLLAGQTFERSTTSRPLRLVKGGGGFIGSSQALGVGGQARRSPPGCFLATERSWGPLARVVAQPTARSHSASDT